MAVSGEQLRLKLEWGDQPWGGWSPRSLAKCNVKDRIRLRASFLGTCVVDNSVVRCESREAPEQSGDPHQYQLFVRTSI